MTIHATFDRYGRKPSRESKVSFEAALGAERYYVNQLRKIAKQVYDYVRVMWKYDIQDMIGLNALLNKYTQLIEPWARSVTDRMHKEIAARNLIQWNSYMETLGAELQREIRDAPIGARMRQLMNEQVGLIQSLPRKEAQRVHELTMKGLTEGTRYSEVREQILGPLQTAHPDWSDIQIYNRATLIARTETARTASILTQARAEAVGSTTYVWRTARDGRVRPSHKALEGTTHKWDEPPLCDAPDYHAHPGAIFNCRCYAHPIIPLYGR